MYKKLKAFIEELEKELKVLQDMHESRCKTDVGEIDSVCDIAECDYTISMLNRVLAHLA